jgi:hypothetical protein
VTTPWPLLEIYNPGSSGSAAASISTAPTATRHGGMLERQDEDVASGAENYRPSPT